MWTAQLLNGTQMVGTVKGSCYDLVVKRVAKLAVAVQDNGNARKLIAIFVSKNAEEINAAPMRTDLEAMLRKGGVQKIVHILEF